MPDPTKFSYIKQSGNLACGPTCLRMIAQHYGKIHSENCLRRLIGKPQGRFSVLDLSKAASKIGFIAHGMKITFKQLCEVTLPCIVHWNDNHFVVVYKIDRLPTTDFGTFTTEEISKYLIQVADPAHGMLGFSKNGFEKGWFKIKELNMGIALVLKPDPKAKF